MKSFPKYTRIATLSAAALLLATPALAQQTPEVQSNPPINMELPQSGPDDQSNATNEANTIATSLAAVAHAQDFPDWPLREVCSSGDYTCPRFEQRARGKISGVWSTLPPEARKVCVAQTTAVGNSYRLLSSCLANAMQQLLTNQQRHSEDG